MDASLFKYRIRLLAAKRKRTAPIKFSFTRPAVTGTSVPCHGTINRRSTTVPMPCYIWTIHMSIAWLMSIKRCAKRWRKGKRKYPVYRRRPSGKSLRLHASGLKTELVLMLTGFKRRRSCNSKLCPLTQQRARWRHKYYGTPSKPDQYLRKTTAYSQAVVPVAAEHPADNRSLRRQAGHRRR